jgi:hypothetical protein
MASSKHLENGMKIWILTLFHMILLDVNQIPMIQVDIGGYPPFPNGSK